MADGVLEVTGRSPLLKLALGWSGSRSDDYFVSAEAVTECGRYSGIIHQADGVPSGDVLSAVRDSVVPGWLAQCQEMLEDPEQEISPPRQNNMSEDERPYVPPEGPEKA